MKLAPLEWLEAARPVRRRGYLAHLLKVAREDMGELHLNEAQMEYASERYRIPQGAGDLFYLFLWRTGLLWLIRKVRPHCESCSLRRIRWNNRWPLRWICRLFPTDEQ